MTPSRFQLAFVTFVLICCSTGLEAQSESEKLNVRVGEFYQKGELDAAIPLAIEIVAIERRRTPILAANLTNALESLGRLKLDRVKRSLAELRKPDLDQQAAMATLALLRRDAAESADHFREAITLSGDSKSNIQQAISLRTKLAWLSYNYIPADTNTKFGFDKDSRDKLELRHRAIHIQHFEDARKFYREALDIAERSDNTAAALGARFSLAEFESAMGNFEVASPLYEKIIAEAERMLPSRSPELVAPYEAYLKVLVATSQEDKAFDILSRIVAVTGRSAEYPKTLLNLTRRAERAFAPVNSVRVEEDAKKVKAERELAVRSGVARDIAAGRPDALSGALANSTDGRLYYETLATRGIRLQREIVRVEIDEKGRVVSAAANSPDRILQETAEGAVRAWAFRPLLVEGKPARLKGYVEVSILSN
jgi:tetratricopeptide (TPR) repeat protein